MSDSQFKPNSHKVKAEEAKKPVVAKVISGKASIKKKSGVSKFVSLFVRDDVENVKDYVIKEVVIPTIQRLILDSITESASMIFGYDKNRKTSSSASYVSYESRFSESRNRRTEPRLQKGFEYDSILFESRGEAEEVLDTMCDMLEMYGIVSVSDLYDLAGLDSPYTANRYGWTSLRSAEPARTRDGYILRLPRPSAID